MILCALRQHRQRHEKFHSKDGKSDNTLLTIKCMSSLSNSKNVQMKKVMERKTLSTFLLRTTTYAVLLLIGVYIAARATNLNQVHEEDAKIVLDITTIERFAKNVSDMFLRAIELSWDDKEHEPNMIPLRSWVITQPKILNKIHYAACNLSKLLSDLRAMDKLEIKNDQNSISALQRFLPEYERIIHHTDDETLSDIISLLNPVHAGEALLSSAPEFTIYFNLSIQVQSELIHLIKTLRSGLNYDKIPPPQGDVAGFPSKALRDLASDTTILQAHKVQFDEWAKVSHADHSHSINWKRSMDFITNWRLQRFSDIVSMRALVEECLSDKQDADGSHICTSYIAAMEENMTDLISIFVDKDSQKKVDPSNVGLHVLSCIVLNIDLVLQLEKQVSSFSPDSVSLFDLNVTPALLQDTIQATTQLQTVLSKAAQDVADLSSKFKDCVQADILAHTELVDQVKRMRRDMSTLADVSPYLQNARRVLFRLIEKFHNAEGDSAAEDRRAVSDNIEELRDILVPISQSTVSINFGVYETLCALFHAFNSGIEIPEQVMTALSVEPTTVQIDAVEKSLVDIHRLNHVLSSFSDIFEAGNFQNSWVNLPKHVTTYIQWDIYNTMISHTLSAGISAALDVCLPRSDVKSRTTDLCVELGVLLHDQIQSIMLFATTLEEMQQLPPDTTSRTDALNDISSQMMRLVDDADAVERKEVIDTLAFAELKHKLRIRSQEVEHIQISHLPHLMRCLSPRSEAKDALRWHIRHGCQPKDCIFSVYRYSAIKAYVHYVCDSMDVFKAPENADAYSSLDYQASLLLKMIRLDVSRDVHDAAKGTDNEQSTYSALVQLFRSSEDIIESLKTDTKSITGAEENLDECEILMKGNLPLKKQCCKLLSSINIMKYTIRIRIVRFIKQAEKQSTQSAKGDKVKGSGDTQIDTEGKNRSDGEKQKPDLIDSQTESDLEEEEEEEEEQSEQRDQKRQVDSSEHQEQKNAGSAESHSSTAESTSSESKDNKQGKVDLKPDRKVSIDMHRTHDVDSHSVPPDSDHGSGVPPDSKKSNRSVAAVIFGLIVVVFIVLLLIFKYMKYRKAMHSVEEDDSTQWMNANPVEIPLHSLNSENTEVRMVY